MKAKLICTGILALAASFGAAAQETSRNVTDPTASCIVNLAGEPRLKLIADKVALGRGINIPARFLERAPNADERSALAIWLEMRQDCFNEGAKYRHVVSTPGEIELARDAFDYQQQMVAELKAGRMTYVQFNNRRMKLANFAAGHDL